MSTRARLLAGAAALTATVGMASAQVPAPLPKAATGVSDPLMPRTLPPALPVSRPTAQPPAAPIKPAVPELKTPAAPPAAQPPAVMPGDPAAPHMAPMALPPAGPGCGPTGGCAPAAPKEPEYDPWAELRGPKCPDIWASYQQGLMWFQPAPVDLPLAVGGRPGEPVRTLLGGSDKEYGQFNSFGFDVGAWIDRNHVRGVGAGGFITEHRYVIERFAAGPGSNNPTLTVRRPFTSLVTNTLGQTAPTNDSILVADPTTPGSISLENTARFSSAYVNYKKLVAHTDHYTGIVFVGFRYYDLDESLRVIQRTTLPAGQLVGGTFVNAGTPIRVTDRFRTRNQFYGGEAGGRFEWHQGRGFFALMPRLAFGPNHQVLEVVGETRAGATVRAPGGLLAAGRGPADGNLGRFSSSRFSVAGDMGVQAGARVTDCLRLAVGYNFLFLNNVVRPGSQFDGVTNTRVVPLSQAFGSVSGPVSPRVTNDREGFYAHGVTFTFELMY